MKVLGIFAFPEEILYYQIIDQIYQEWKLISELRTLKGNIFAYWLLHEGGETMDFV